MYKIELARQAAKELEIIYRSDKNLYSRFIHSIDALKKDPFQGKKLKGQFKGDYSLRVGNYRVIYAIYREKLLIYIIDLGHRKGIYQR